MIFINHKLINKPARLNSHLGGNKGFTLLETLVAVFILTLALNSLFTLVSSSLFSSMYAKNEITGTYLAQEAVDYIRNDRDSIAFQGFNSGDWNSFLLRYGYDNSQNSPTLSSCFSSDGCNIDASNFDVASIKPCSGSCSPFVYDSEATKGSYYTYDNTIANATPTTFKRTIKLSLDSNNPDELDVKVTVDWTNGISARSRILRTSLLKWQ